eukprot:2484722-Amphidinium_carterae.2
MRVDGCSVNFLCLTFVLSHLCIATLRTIDNLWGLGFYSLFGCALGCREVFSLFDTEGNGHIIPSDLLESAKEIHLEPPMHHRQPKGSTRSKPAL